MNELSWFWIGVALIVPLFVGLVVAFPFWRKGQIILGSIAGMAFIFASAFALISREYVELDRLMQECLDEGVLCWPNPTAFTRFAIYAFIGLLHVLALFSLGIVVEQRIRRRNYAPEWR